MPASEAMRSLAEEIVSSYEDRMAGIARLRETVEMDLKEFQDSRRAMGREVRADLTKGVADRKRDIGTLLRGFSAELKDIGSELAGGRDEWQKMTATMPSKGGGAAIVLKPPVAESAEEATLRHRVFEYLANHPDGTKMTELEQEFRLARIQMAKLLKKLMDENKVKKQGLLYLAV